MNEEPTSKKVWPALSFTLLYVFINLSLYIFLALKPSFPIYIAMIVLNILWVAIALFLELSGARKKLWKTWKSLPIIVHKIICGICGFWIGFLSLKALIPAIKKDYEKN